MAAGWRRSAISRWAVATVVTGAAGVAAVAVVRGQAPAVGTVPLSPHAVTLRLTLADGLEATVRVLNGGMARISREHGASLGITPVIGVPHRVVLFDVGLSPDGEPRSLRQGASVEVEPGKPAALAWNGGPLEVTWLDVAPVDAGKFRRARAAVAPEEVRRSDGPCSQCCVTCSGVSVCACLVQTPCGNGCCPEACDCP